MVYGDQDLRRLPETVCIFWIKLKMFLSTFCFCFPTFLLQKGVRMYIFSINVTFSNTRRKFLKSHQNFQFSRPPGGSSFLQFFISFHDKPRKSRDLNVNLTYQQSRLVVSATWHLASRLWFQSIRREAKRGRKIAISLSEKQLLNTCGKSQQREDVAGVEWEAKLRHKF